MNAVFITGLGLYHPPKSVSNDELVASFNQYVDEFNQENADKIQSGEITALDYSSSEFIEKASGIRSRYLVDPEHVLDTHFMQPVLSPRPDTEVSIQAEMAIKAAELALKDANKKAEEIDLIIVSCSNFQRAYPAISIEVQAAIGAKGHAYDMNVACSSATFAIANAYAAIRSGQVKTALLINPEICSAHLNFRDRDSHFIFGDACTATILESQSALSKSQHVFEIVDTHLSTQFSNNIRNNFGFLTRAESDVYNDPRCIYDAKNMFTQQGRRVFRDVVPLVSSLIHEHFEKNHITIDRVKRLWLHQANAHMNQLIAEKVLSRKPDNDIAPIILDTFANTSSPGCLIAFMQYHEDLKIGDIGLLCSFGAGYSAGSIIIKKHA